MGAAELAQRVCAILSHHMPFNRPSTAELHAVTVACEQADATLTEERDRLREALGEATAWLERDIASRQRELDGSVEKGFLRINHGEGESQHREIRALKRALEAIRKATP